MQHMHWLVMAAMLAGTCSATAEESSVSQLLTCAATEVTACVPGGGCTSGTPAQFNLPVLFKLDIAKKVAESPRTGGANRVSAIASVTQVGDVTVLQGADGADGWTARIDHSTGQMALVSADESGSYVVFGACAAL